MVCFGRTQNEWKRTITTTVSTLVNFLLILQKTSLFTGDWWCKSRCFTENKIVHPITAESVIPLILETAANWNIIYTMINSNVQRKGKQMNK